MFFRSRLRSPMLRTRDSPSPSSRTGRNLNRRSSRTTRRNSNSPSSRTRHISRLGSSRTRRISNSSSPRTRRDSNSAGIHSTPHYASTRHPKSFCPEYEDHSNPSNRKNQKQRNF
ncbi:unnamed protein product [Caenorhabditis angaria]|uniref:Uncharacterized protein n=1 Tax=Caenorhabditis angaria TaxID=860376 RepID=A0A9P1N4X6_9PELO|nr:unnamed protein product [Caenorhabditis angaria]